MKPFNDVCSQKSDENLRIRLGCSIYLERPLQSASLCYNTCRLFLCELSCKQRFRKWRPSASKIGQGLSWKQVRASRQHCTSVLTNYWSSIHTKETPDRAADWFCDLVGNMLLVLQHLLGWPQACPCSLLASNLRSIISPGVTLGHNARIDSSIVGLRSVIGESRDISMSIYILAV